MTNVLEVLFAGQEVAQLLSVIQAGYGIPPTAAVKIGAQNSIFVEME